MAHRGTPGYCRGCQSRSARKLYKVRALHGPGLWDLCAKCYRKAMGNQPVPSDAWESKENQDAVFSLLAKHTLLTLSVAAKLSGNTEGVTRQIFLRLHTRGLVDLVEHEARELACQAKESEPPADE